MSDNIISPTFTNGITIAVMGLIGFGVLFVLAQGALHLLHASGGGSQ